METSTTDVKLEPEGKPETTKDPETEESQEKEKDTEDEAGEESKKLLDPEDPTITSSPAEKKASSTYEISAALARTATFAQKLKTISIEKPPTRNPLAYIGAVFGLCFAGTAVGLGICCCVGSFLLLEIIPIAAIVMGATYWDRTRYCTAENVPLLLIIGGVLKVIHITLSTAAGRDQSNARKVVENIAASKKNKKKDDADVEANVEEEKDEAGEKDEKNGEKTDDGGENTEEKSGEKDQGQVPVSPPEGNAWFRLGNALLTVAELTWFITATVIIYGMYATVSYSKEDANLENYCHQTLYRFAFWYITVFYVLLGLVIFVPLTLCCCGLVALLVGSE
ncbi:uncharacterized protein LOC118437775 [Folsomia candida]|uniref:Transmembrane protein n=1 Tax=Folsomia candida TaxID=158441 RepID=A0A226DP62_FOLCA|nr:uncharacterized protein LOC118437775 [Folsomia candida]OXA46016.1 hypothetical protein Fcan01_19366 [Folsomia candida]